MTGNHDGTGYPKRLELDLNFKDGIASGVKDLHFVIPAGFQSNAILRKRHFLFLVSELVRAGFPNIVIALQDIPGNEDIEGELIERFEGKIKIVHIKVGRNQYWKARQVNEASDHIPDRDWVFQLDADVLPPIKVLVERWMDKKNRAGVDFIKPWNFFYRINHSESREFLESRKVSVNTKKQSFVDLTCAGGFLIRKRYFRECGGLDEEFQDWGWEDVALRAIVVDDDNCEKRQINNPAIHLHHESDRPYNPDDLETLKRKYPEDELSKQRTKEVDVNASIKAKTQFAVMSMGRSGSNMLRSALVTHPDVKMPPGEPFGPPGKLVSYGMERGCNSNNLRKFILNEVLKGGFDCNARGFLLHYDHPIHNPSFNFQAPRLHEVMRNMEFRFIHLYRKDILSQVASYALATRHNTYKDTPYPTEPVVIEDISRILRVIRVYVKNLYAFHRETLEAGEDSVYLPVAYEDLTSDMTGELTRIQEFLGLPIVDLKPTTKKQSRVNSKELIANLDEIAEALKNTILIPEEIRSKDGKELFIEIPGH